MSHADYQSLVDRLAAAGTSAPAATTTSRMLRRIELPQVERPTFRSTPYNLRYFGRWWLANAREVLRYYEACEAALKASGEWIAPVCRESDLEAFAATLYQSECWAHNAITARGDRNLERLVEELRARRNEP